MGMTQAVAHIFEAVGRFSAAKQRELQLAIVEKIPESGDLTEDDFGALAAASLRSLDEEKVSA
jgi:hypothetical protein